MQTHTIAIDEWNLEQFKQAKDAWNELLVRSECDRLFLSWEWQYTWWTTFSEPESMTLKLLVATDENETLIGIAPYYLTRLTTKKFIPTKRLQFIGDCWRGKATMKTELMQIITDKNRSAEIVRSFYQYLVNDKEWDELIMSDLIAESPTYRTLIEQKPFTKAYYRITENYQSYYLPLTTDFDHYLKHLGKNTRLRLFNRRKLLEECGELRIERTAKEQIDQSFDLLNELHIKRWGRPAFPGKRLEFNKTIARLFADKDELCFSVIYVNDTPVSIQYNYILDSHVYNIQAGFDENFHKKIALGYLHFGYEIEHAYTRGLKVYDFLAGEGKKTQYKEQLTNELLNVVEIQVVRSRALRLLYRFYDKLKPQ